MTYIGADQVLSEIMERRNWKFFENKDAHNLSAAPDSIRD